MTHHTNEDVATISEGGEDVVHELLVPEPPLGLVVCCVVAVCDQQAGPRQSAKDYLQNQNTKLDLAFNNVKPKDTYFVLD